MPRGYLLVQGEYPASRVTGEPAASSQSGAGDAGRGVDASRVDIRPKSPHTRVECLSVAGAIAITRPTSGHARPPDPSNADLRPRARARDRPGHPAGLRGRPDRRPRLAVPRPSSVWRNAASSTPSGGTSEQITGGAFYTLTPKVVRSCCSEESEWRRIAAAIMRVLGPQTRS